MKKLVILKLGDGSLDAGLSVILQISEDGQRPTVELTGSLPPAPELHRTYEYWQIAYRCLGVAYRLEIGQGGFATNVSKIEDCRELAQELSEQFNHWLSSESFRPLTDKLLEQLTPQDQIRIILQTQLTTVQRLPWHTWGLCDRYPKAELALSAPNYEYVAPRSSNRSKVRILAILGHSQGLDVQTDQALLNHLPNAEVQVLVEPNRHQLNQQLWDSQGWDILFFAGHSASQLQDCAKAAGRLYLNPDDSLTLPELKLALRKSLARGLKIALFNSCDGLGLAQALAELHIPQVLVMREPVPDRIAHEFLKSFLEAFSRGEPFYLAVREAREKLQGLEDHYPCASWLPIIFQNPAELPPTWPKLNGSHVNSANVEELPTSQLLPSPLPTLRWPAILLASVVTTAATLGLRQMSLFQPWELRGLDYLMQLRRQELPDSRILIITITPEDVQAQDVENRNGSLSDAALSSLLQTLEPLEPRVIGLDIYRDFPVSASQPQLVQQLQSTEQLLATCKASDVDHAVPGIPPPVEVPSDRIGFSDFLDDPDGIVRRQLLAHSPEPASPCQAAHAFSTLLALKYLEAEGIEPKATAEGYLQLESVVFEPMKADFGGYQNISAWGHQILLNYRQLPSPEKIAQQATLSDVLEGRVNPEAIRDRVVLIGSTDRSFGDYWLTPYCHRRTGLHETAGVFMQAQMISQLLSAALGDRPLIQSWPDWAETLWIFGWAATGGVVVYGAEAASKGRLSWLIWGGLGAEASLFGLCWLILIQTGYWVPWIPAAIVIVGTIGGVTVYVKAKKFN